MIWWHYKAYLNHQLSEDLSAPDAKIILKLFTNPQFTVGAFVIAVIDINLHDIENSA